MSESAGKGGGGGGLRQGVCTCVSVFLLLAGATALTAWLVYRPQKPRFTVVGAAVYELNLTYAAPQLISTAFQFTLLARNPNKRVSIYYDRLSATVYYRDEAITPPTALPPLYHHHRSTVALSPILGPGPVPVSSAVANGLAVEQAAYGVVGLRVVVLGRVRWKAGAIKTVHYGMYLNCDVVVGLKKGFVGQTPLLRPPECKLDL